MHSHSAVEPGTSRSAFTTVHVNTSDNSALVRAKDSNKFSRVNGDAVLGPHGETLEAQSISKVDTSEHRRDPLKRGTCDLYSSALVRAKDSNIFSRVNGDAVLGSHGKTLEAQSINIVDTSEHRRDPPKRDTSDLCSGGNSIIADSHSNRSQPDHETLCRDGVPTRRLSDSNFKNRIPVHIQGSVTGQKTDMFRKSVPVEKTSDNMLSDDIDFTTFVRKRTRRYYIGGFKPTITREKLIAYVESQGQTVTWVNIWVNNRNGRAIIRLNVEMTEGYHIIAETGFWPKGVKCRPWVTKPKYNASRKKAGSQAQSSRDNDYNQAQYSNEHDRYEEYGQYDDNGLPH